MSGNEDNKGNINKVYPLDLVSKLNIKPVTELPKGTPLLMSGQPLPLRRVLTQAVAVSSSSNNSTAINIVPQTIIKQGILNQNQSLATVKPTQITLATSVVQSGSTYHVPRGPAAVANLATPRSAVASPIRAPGHPGGGIVATQPSTSGSGFVSTVRQVTPSRAPSPATTWLTNNMQIQNQQIVQNVSSSSSSITTTTSATQLQRISTVVGRTQIITRTTQSTSVNVGQLRQPPQQQQQQIFKTTMAQVLPTRPQTLVYSAPHHHFMARKPVTTTTTTVTTSSNVATTSVRPLNQMIGTRVAVPVPVTTTRLTVTPGPTTIYTTGARLSTHSIVGGTGARVNVQQSVNRSGIPSAGTLLATTQARIATVAAGAPQQQQQQQQNAVVIGTQAGGRLAASVVSFHPVAVGNPSSSSGSGSTKQQQQSSKIITQSNQGAIQLAQVPAVAKLPIVSVSSTMSVASGTRTINTAIVSQRPIISVPQSQTISIPITKVFPPQGTTTATPIIRRATTSPIASNSKESEVTTYYYHDTVTGNNSNTNTSSSQFQFSPVMVVDQKQQPPQTMEHIMNPLPSIGKVTSSPRPSILRKRDRDGDGSTLKAAKNLAPLLSNIGGGVVSQGPSSPTSRPLSCDNNDNSSGGSTTISATSSPGLGEIGGDDSEPLPLVVVQPPAAEQVALTLVEVKRQQQQEEENTRRHHAQEMSPRKKPRKQQLIGNDEPKFNIDDMQFLSENKMKKHEHHVQQLSTIPTTISATPTKPSINQNNELTVKKPQSASLLNSYRQTWKSTHNHYVRYTDVKPKDERRPTIIDLANQTQVMQKINGWKIHHLSTQMEDLSDLETQVYDKLSTMLKLIETKESRGYDKEFNRINELIKGNMQRNKIINDSTSEAKNQVMKIFDHKDHVADIIQRCASKRNFKKREK